MVREIEVGSKRDRQKERRGTRLNRKVEIAGERGAELSPKQNDIALLQELDTPSYCGRQFKEHVPVAWLAVRARIGVLKETECLSLGGLGVSTQAFLAYRFWSPLVSS